MWISKGNLIFQFICEINAIPYRPKDSYDGLRNQILVLDPLPTIYKEYSMALSVEKHRERERDIFK